jgi:DNA-binding response OmpR family regulator
MSTIHILYAEDDTTLAFLTKDNLEQNQYSVIHCEDGKAGVETFKKGSFDICILDIMMPRMDGFELASEIRKLDKDIPIIFLSAKTLKEDRIKGLRLGADDYLIKPFSIEELLLKIDIFFRRSSKNIPAAKEIYEIVKCFFDTKNFVLFNTKEQISLTEREAELLKLFVENKNNILKREHILTTLCGHDAHFMGRSLDVFISRLRKILINETAVTIENVHGIGFRFKVD